MGGWFSPRYRMIKEAKIAYGQNDKYNAYRAALSAAMRPNPPPRTSMRTYNAVCQRILDELTFYRSFEQPITDKETQYCGLTEETRKALWVLIFK